MLCIKFPSFILYLRKLILVDLEQNFGVKRLKQGYAEYYQSTANYYNSPLMLHNRVTGMQQICWTQKGRHLLK